MKKQILKFALLCAGVVMLLASCGKDIDDEQNFSNEKDNSSQETETVMYYPLYFTNLSKNWVDNYESFVYIKSGGGSTFTDSKKYRTIRLRNLEETIVQEWLLENLHTTSIKGYHFADRDGDGVDDDCFYRWSDAGSDMLNPAIWDKVIFSPSHQNVKGFHLPTIFEIRQLCSMFNNMYDMLDMIEFDQTSFDGSYDVDNLIFLSSRMFINELNEPHPECGTSVYFGMQYGSPSAHITLTNNPDERCVVRLVRYLSKEEW